MNFRHHSQHESQAIVQLFASVFTASEGETEGTLIGRLAEDLFEKTDAQDLFNFVAEDEGRIVGAISFSRMRFEDDNDMETFLLAPVAVHSDHQGKGIGQALINHGLKELKDAGVGIVFTYGDPAFYGKVGFRPISPETVAAPFELSFPEGWLGQSLLDDSTEMPAGKCTCVEAFNNSVYW
ncbi:GNAT family N-acetyltransferase [bacterium]|nr:GNAT family N-acetyltransferase [bacterium]